MENAINWGIIGVFTLLLTIFFLTGIIRGIKRSGLHIAFVIVAAILALLLTKTITNVVLGIRINIEGTNQSLGEYILSIVEKSFDLSNFKTATDFVLAIPMAVASPAIFMILQIVITLLFEIIYLIVARVSFGKKKEDFAKHKPYRAYGGILGLVEGLFLIILAFAPITSLTKTADAILYSSSTVSASSEEDNFGELKTINELVGERLPQDAEKYLNLYNNSVIAKVSSFAGINNMMFDYLSSFNLNGEKITFRKEIETTAKTYDSFVIVYNALSNENYDVSVTSLKENIKELSSSGIFKTVICESIRDFVVGFDPENDYMIEIPEVVKDFALNMKTIFSNNKFNSYNYFKHDIDAVLDVGESVVKDKLIKKYKELEDQSLTTLLNFVYQNSNVLEKDTKKLVSLNIVKDNFSYIAEKISDKLEEVVESDGTLEIEINEKATLNENLVEKVYTIVNNLKEINDIANITDLVSDDFFTKLSEIEDVDTIFEKIGNTLDTAREIELLVIPVSEDHPTKTYVVDNILKTFDLELLGDCDSYETFFSALAEPVKNVKELGFIDIINGEEIDIISILNKVKVKPNILADTIVPFYDFKNTKVGEKTLKELVFDEAITTLSDEIGILDFSQYQLAANDTKENWVIAFVGLGNTLKQLHSINVGTTGKTFAKFLIDGGDIKDLQMSDIGKVLDIIKLNAYNDGNTLKGVLNDKFAEAVYVMTGDKIVSGKEYTGLTKIDNYQDIKAYIDAGLAGYYQVSFEQKLAQVDKAIELCDNLKNSTEGLDVKTQTQAVVDGLKDATDAMGMTDEELVETLENLEDLVSSKPDRKIFDTGSLTAEEKEEARNKINETYAGHTAVANALISLLGI